MEAMLGERRIRDSPIILGKSLPRKHHRGCVAFFLSFAHSPSVQLLSCQLSGLSIEMLGRVNYDLGPSTLSSVFEGSYT